MAVKDAYNYRQIDDRLSTSGLLSLHQLDELGQEGYQIVIDLLPHDNEWAVEGEQGVIERQDIDYRYIPVDFDEPLGSDYDQFEQALASTGTAKTHVHCAANMRVSAFYAIYGSRKLGWTEAQARAFIAETWNLGDFPVWDAFVTEMLAA
jgi:protein tyrosine phosphatase (PTP) superfamily phosphohydrolase (DUF442 family)